MNKVKGSILAAMTTVVIACTQQTAQEHIDIANRLLQENDQKAAVIELRNAAKKEPNNIEVRYILAETYFSMGQLASAEKEYAKALELGKNANSVAVPLARSLYLQDKFSDLVYLNIDPSISDTQTLNDYNSLVSMAHFRLGEFDQSMSRLAFAGGDTPNSSLGKVALAYNTWRSDKEQALSLVTEALKQTPTSIEGLMLSGFLNTNLNNFEQAENSFNKVLEQIPSLHTVRLYLADVYVKNRKLEEAQKQADFILKIAHEQPLANQIKAVALFEQRDYAQALRHAEKAIQNGINSDSNKLLAGLSAFQTENFEQAHNFLSSIRARLGEGHPAKKAFAMTQLRLGYTVDVSDTLDSIGDFGEQDSELLTAASYEMIRAGNLSLAKKTVNTLSSIDLNSAESLTQLGVLKLSLNDLEGLTSLEKAIAIDESLPQARMALAAAYIQTGNYDRALTLGLEWLEEDANNKEGLNLVALAYLNKKDYPQAENHFAKALAVDEKLIAPLMYFASKHYLAEEHSDADNYLTKVLAQKSDYIPALRLNYKNKTQLGSGEQGLDAIKQAAEAPLASYALQLLYAEALYSKRQFKGAIEYLTQLETLNADKASRHWNLLAAAYIKNNDLNNAIDTFGSWLTVSPRLENVWLKKIELEELNVSLTRALGTAEAALLQMPQSVKVTLTKASLLAKSGNGKDAEKLLDSLPNEVNELSFAKTVRGHVMALKGNNRSALPLLLEGYESEPQLQNATLVFVTYKALGQHDEAYSFMENHIKANGADLKATLLLANELLFKQPGKSKQYYSVLAQHKTDNALVYNNLAYLHLKDNELEQADEIAARAVEMAPNTAAYLDTAGMVKIALNEKDAAIRLLRKANRLNPNDADIKNNLRKAEAL